MSTVRLPLLNDDGAFRSGVTTSNQSFSHVRCSRSQPRPAVREESQGRRRHPPRNRYLTAKLVGLGSRQATCVGVQRPGVVRYCGFSASPQGTATDARTPVIAGHWADVAAPAASALSIPWEHRLRCYLGLEPPPALEVVRLVVQQRVGIVRSGPRTPWLLTEHKQNQRCG